MTRREWWFLADVLTDCLVFDRHHANRGTYTVAEGMKLWEVQNAMRSEDINLVRIAHKPIRDYLDQHGLRMADEPTDA